MNQSITISDINLIQLYPTCPKILIYIIYLKLLFYSVRHTTLSINYMDLYFYYLDFFACYETNNQLIYQILSHHMLNVNANYVLKKYQQYIEETKYIFYLNSTEYEYLFNYIEKSNLSMMSLMINSSINPYSIQCIIINSVQDNNDEPNEYLLSYTGDYIYYEMLNYYYLISESLSDTIFIAALNNRYTFAPISDQVNFKQIIGNKDNNFILSKQDNNSVSKLKTKKKMESQVITKFQHVVYNQNMTSHTNDFDGKKILWSIIYPIDNNDLLTNLYHAKQMFLLSSEHMEKYYYYGAILKSHPNLFMIKQSNNIYQCGIHHTQPIQSITTFSKNINTNNQYCITSDLFQLSYWELPTYLTEPTNNDVNDYCSYFSPISNYSVSEPIQTVHCTHNPRYFHVSLQNGQILFWDIISSLPSNVYNTYHNDILSTTSNHSLNLIFAPTKTSLAHLYDIRSKRFIQCFPFHQIEKNGGIQTKTESTYTYFSDSNHLSNSNIQYSPNEHLILQFSNNATMSIWDIRYGKSVVKEKQVIGNMGRNEFVQDYYEDNNHIYIQSNTGSTYMWDREKWYNTYFLSNYIYPDDMLCTYSYVPENTNWGINSSILDYDNKHLIIY